MGLPCTFSSGTERGAGCEPSNAVPGIESRSAPRVALVLGCEQRPRVRAVMAQSMGAKTGILLEWLIDTGADVSCVPSWLWPGWPVECTAGLQGVGGSTRAGRSKTDVYIFFHDPDTGRTTTATVRPYIVDEGPEPLLGRDALVQLRFRVSNLP